MSDLLGKPALNIPLLVDIRFSKKVAQLNASCFDLVNINNLNIIGFNPYFVVHAFPHDEGLCSIQLKERELCLLPLSCLDCVLTASKTETFPGTDRIVAFFDVQAPIVAFPLGDKVFLSSKFYQIIQYSEPTNALANYKYLELQNTALNSVIDVSPTL